MLSSLAMTGIHTVSNLASRLPMPVMQVMHAMMVAARLRETTGGGSWMWTTSRKRGVPSRATLGGKGGMVSILSGMSV